MEAFAGEAVDRVLAELRALPEGAAAGPDAAFALAFLEREHALPRAEALDRIALTDPDLGLNAFHLAPDLGNATLYRFAWSAQRTIFQAPLERLIETGLASVFGADAPGLVPDPFLVRLRSALLTYQGKIERVFVQFVFRGDPAQAERSTVYERMREELENRKHLADAFFGRPVTMVFQFRSDAGDLAAPAHQRVTHAYPLRMESPVVRTGPAGERMRVGFAHLMDLHAMYRAMGQRLFESNIRAMLAEDTPTNRSLVRAFEAVVLAGTADPLAYTFDHNGVTLSAERADERDGRLVLTEPRILNGAQTIATLDRFLTARAADPRLAAGRQRLDQLAVTCKIITDAKTDFVLRVALNNNRQNPVKPWNLHANDLIQLGLQDKFHEELGLYYERQERAFAELDEADREELELKDHRAVELLRLARTFLAADGELDRLARLTDVFEDEVAYRETFSSGRLQADARRILLCYKIQFRLARIVRELTERSERKYGYLKRARNLLWALLCQALLNDPELDRCAAEWGVRLALEPAFTDRLVKLADTQVRPAVVAATAPDAYARKIEAESFGFLRTHAFFEACLKAARDQSGWTRRALG